MGGNEGNRPARVDVPARPGTQLGRLALHFFLVLDCSGSMNVGGRIQALNNAVREVIPHLRAVADEHPGAAILLRVLAFSTGVRWVVADPTPVHDVRWVDLDAAGYTDMGKALSTLAEAVEAIATDGRALPPAIVLVSDGEPTDNFDLGLQELNMTRLGRHAVRLAVAIGHEANTAVLARFQDTGREDAPAAPLEAHNPEQLVRAIKWASVAVSLQASEGSWEDDWLVPQPTDLSEGPAVW